MSLTRNDVSQTLTWLAYKTLHEDEALLLEYDHMSSSDSYPQLIGWTVDNSIPTEKYQFQHWEPADLRFVVRLEHYLEARYPIYWDQIKRMVSELERRQNTTFQWGLFLLRVPRRSENRMSLIRATPQDNR